MQRLAVFLFVFGCACKKEENRQPPPIVSGKCLVDRYAGSRAVEQSCTFEGYAWQCTYDKDTASNICTRVGEPGQERAAVPVPADASRTVLDTATVDAPVAGS